MSQDSAPKTQPPGRMKTALMRLGVLGELISLFAGGDRWWLAPLALLLGVVGLVMVVLQSIEYVAPFVYLTF